jgi:UDP-hydrolysing UDP-N-acetyl-D-glucosamine 2-epimerase
VRNALTKMSHIHFTSTEGARDRVIAMGEEPWRVQRAGAPSLDHLRRSRLWSLHELEERLGLDLERPTIVVAYHPVTIMRDTTQEADSLFAALREVDAQILFCYPNADAGSLALLERSRAFVSSRSDARIYVNLDSVTYWSLLRCAALLIGNSSSGIMEAASFALPVVNVGFRQSGRERARNVLDARPEPKAILAGIAEAMSLEFRASLAGMTNPYGDGHASEKIVNVLATVALSEGLLVKSATR